MTCYDTELNTLQAQLARRQQVETVVAELTRQRQALSARVAALGQVRRREEADVERLEGRSLAALFCRLRGNMEETRSREQREAAAARLKYEAAALELSGVEEELERYQAEWNTLRECEKRYQTLLEEKAQSLKAAGGTAAEELRKLEEQLAFQENQLRELREAAAAGNDALAATEQILSSLDSAEGWGTWDLLGGGLLSDLAKHSHLDEAQSGLDLLQSKLRRFQTELADVRICGELHIQVDGFLRFADYFFDGLFADLAVLEHIRHSSEQVCALQGQLHTALAQLEELRLNREREAEELRARRDTLVRETAMM